MQLFTLIRADKWRKDNFSPARRHNRNERTHQRRSGYQPLALRRILFFYKWIIAVTFRLFIPITCVRAKHLEKGWSSESSGEEKTPFRLKSRAQNLMKAQSACWLVCDLYVPAAFHDWPDWPVHHRSPVTVCHHWGCSCSAVISSLGIKQICCGKLRLVAVGILVEKSSPAEEKYMTPLRRLQPSTGATAPHEISVQGLDNTLLLKEDPQAALGGVFFFFFAHSQLFQVLDSDWLSSARKTFA